MDINLDVMDTKGFEQGVKEGELQLGMGCLQVGCTWSTGWS